MRNKRSEFGDRRQKEDMPRDPFKGNIVPPRVGTVPGIHAPFGLRPWHTPRDSDPLVPAP